MGWGQKQQNPEVFQLGDIGGFDQGSDVEKCSGYRYMLKMKHRESHDRLDVHHKNNFSVL